MSKKIETLFTTCLKKLKCFLPFFENQKKLHLSYMFENFFANVFDNGDFFFGI